MDTFNALNKFLLRRPFGTWDQFNKTVQDGDFSSTAKKILDFFKNPQHAYALHIASPNLYEQYQMLLEKRDLEISKHQSLFLPLYKYMARMTCRATPFGMFAGCAAGEISESTQLNLNQSYTTARLDMDYLFHLSYHLGQCPSLRPHLKYNTNSTLWKNGKALRYIERKFTNKGYKYIISEVEHNEFLEELVSLCQTPQKIEALSQILFDYGIEIQDAENYIHQLIDHQILVDHLRPSVCGEDYFEKLWTFFNDLPNNTRINFAGKYLDIKEIKESLHRIKQILGELAGLEHFSSIEQLSALYHQLDRLAIPYEKDKLIQTELFYQDGIELDRAWIKKLRAASKQLSYFSALNTWDLGKLSAFAKKFSARYEEAEVNILEVLDTEMGIGYLQQNEELLQGYTHPVETKRFLAQKFLQARESNVLEILPEELDSLPLPRLNLSNSLSFNTQLYQTKEGQDVLYLNGGGYLSGGANVIARFSYGNTKIDKIAKELTTVEDSLYPTDYIIAEVDHIPEGRSGNVLSRPAYYKYVINYLTPPSNDPNVINIPLHDLMISVRAGQVFLRSKKYNKFVVPRITTAHNHHFGKTQPIYQLLGDIQFQFHSNAFSFSWGQLGNLYSRYPRVVCDGHILSKASWKFYSSQIRDLLLQFKAKGKLAIDAWREAYRIPHQVFFTEAGNDQTLLIDFNNDLSIEVFLSLIKKLEQFHLYENLSLEFDSKVKNGANETCHHQVLWFYHKKGQSSKPTDQQDGLEIFPHILKTNTQRSFLPGSEWTYLKIYCGPKTANQVLQKVVHPLIHQFKSALEQWFFIRYYDKEGHHIRLRVKWKKELKDSSFLSAMQAYVSNEQLNKDVHKITLDTYFRELERYDPVIMEQAEALFHGNSKLVLALINKDLSPTEMKLSAFKYIDQLLDAFGLDIQQKLSLVEFSATAFGNEFNLGKRMKKELSTEFKQLKPQIDDFFSPNNYLSKYIDQAVEFNTKEIEIILKQFIEGQMVRSLDDILRSMLHMFINRLYPSEQRYQEMQIFQLLYRYYKQQAHWSKTRTIKGKEVAGLVERSQKIQLVS